MFTFPTEHIKIRRFSDTLYVDCYDLGSKRGSYIQYPDGTQELISTNASKSQILLNGDVIVLSKYTKAYVTISQNKTKRSSGFFSKKESKSSSATPAELLQRFFVKLSETPTCSGGSRFLC